MMIHLKEHLLKLLSKRQPYLSKYNSTTNEMGGACSAYGEEERGVQGFGGET
jgi:hypothetical protein